MTKINWRVRLLSPKFWLALVPAILLLVQTIATPLGYDWDFAGIGTTLTGVINAVFGVLAILGVVTDPTTPGTADSAQALTYGKSKTQQQLDTLAAKVDADDTTQTEPTTEEIEGVEDDTVTDSEGAEVVQGDTSVFTERKDTEEAK